MKGFTYQLVAQNNSINHSYTHLTDAEVESRWDDAKNNGMFTDDDGTEMYCKAGKLFNDARVVNGVVLGPNDGVSDPDEEFGESGGPSGVISTELIDLNTASYRFIEASAINTAVSATSEPGTAQISYTVDSLPDGGVLTQLYGYKVGATLMNTSGATRTIEYKVLKNGVEAAVANSGFTVDDGHSGFIDFADWTDNVADGDVIDVKVWVDGGSVTLTAKTLILFPHSRSYTDGDFTLMGEVSDDPEVANHTPSPSSRDYRLFDPAANAQSVSTTDSDVNEIGDLMRVIRPGQVIITDRTTTTSDASDSAYEAAKYIPSFRDFKYARLWSY